jgi:hypothetical protein
MNGQELQTKSLTVVDEAMGLPAIITQEDFAKAGHLTHLINDEIKRIETYFKKQKVNLDQAKKVVMDQEKEALGPWKTAASHLDPLVASYLREQERLKEEAEERNRAEARKKAEEEILARATKAEAEGQKEVARAILEEPVVAKRVERVAPIPKVAGIAVITNWKCRVVSLPLLIKAVCEDKAPIGCLMADMVFLGKEAKQTKGESPWPGVEFYSEDSVRKG